jgi:hypothetical protein
MFKAPSIFESAPVMLVPDTNSRRRIVLDPLLAESLFEAPGPPLYADVDEELEAVRVRAKGMSAVAFQKTSYETDPNYSHYMRRAADLGLLVTTHHEKPDPSCALHDQVHVFALHGDQAWRIPALIALFEAAVAHDGWSDAMEYMHCSILGYSKVEISAWMAKRHHRRADGIGSTIYLVMPQSEWDALSRFSTRCLTLACDPAKIQLLYPMPYRVLKQSASKLLPCGLVIARVAIKEGINDLFILPDKYRSDAVLLAQLEPRMIPMLNRTMTSDLECWIDGSWRADPQDTSASASQSRSR